MFLFVSINRDEIIALLLHKSSLWLLIFSTSLNCFFQVFKNVYLNTVCSMFLAYFDLFFLAHHDSSLSD